MTIATTTLAARIEGAEADTAAAFARASRRPDLLIEAVGGGTAVYGGAGQPFNKIAGLGFAPLDDGELERLERRYDERGAAMRVELSSLGDASVAAALTHRGYALIGYENVLGLSLLREHVEASARALEAAAERGVLATSTEDSQTWIRAVAEGFASPDTFDGPPPAEPVGREALAQIFADFSAAPGCRLFLARRGGELAGGGALRIVDGLAQLAGAATLPPHRRHGVQSALLHARLVEAAGAGCDLAIVTTEPASTSQQNVQRAGFALLYVRALLVRAASTAAAS
ncbi:MAG TPA: GNAT family N-acetyltransferase [Vicinamibacterales bacterium]|jgi:GNAT superfamily N-acetyltransferase